LTFELESFFAAFSDWQKEAQTKLTGVRTRMTRWHLVHLDCKQIRCAVQDTYKRGRKAFGVLGVDRSAENFHELRKQVKELTFHLRILRPLHAPTFTRLGKRLGGLGDLLGQANDLAFLRERLVAFHKINARHSNWMGLHKAIAGRQAALQRQAAPLAEKFYAEPTSEFTRHIVHHFEAWENSRAEAPARVRNIGSERNDFPQKRTTRRRSKG